MTGGPLNPETRRTKEVMPHSMLVETKERPTRNLIRTLNASTATRRGTRRSTVGQRVVGRKDKDLDPSQKGKNPRRKQQTPLMKERGSGWQ